MPLTQPTKKAQRSRNNRAVTITDEKHRRVLIERLSAQQAATADILRAISMSYSDATPVFEAIVAHAAPLCEANFAFVMLHEEGRLRLTARTACTEEFAGYLANGLDLDRRTTSGRAALARRPIQILDFEADPEVVVTSAHRAERVRTVLAVPLVRDDALLGVITLWRHEVRRFSKELIGLLSTFADHAVIAIENARLFHELQIKNRGLAEALERQSATAQLLRVITSSPAGLQSMLDAVAQRAAHLCGSDDAIISLAEGESLRRVAHFGALTEAASTEVHPIRFEGVGSRAFLERRAIHVDDIVEQFHAGKFLDGRRLQEPIGYRTMLAVPLLRKNDAIGVILLRRMAVQPFTDKQIELLQTFADEVVIAIETARLLDKLQEKSRELERANTYKSRFLAAASHDLRQPLHALNLFAAQLRAAADPKERDRLAVQIGAAIGSMNELFDALLDMSKLDAGVLQPNVTEFAAADVLERLETTFAAIAREKGLRLRVVPTRAWVRSDFILLERVLLNLVSNAVRYTPKGAVIVGCRRRGSRIQFEVRDSGPGIAEDQKTNIFREFYQVAAQGSRHRGGLGLGLAIVDRLSELLEHPVTLESQLGRGSRFCISVPRVRRRVSLRAEAAPVERVVDVVAGKRIVVIDDDALVLEAMRGILASWGCDVVTASRAEGTLTALGGRQPDLIISDYRLGGGRTGIEAIEELRAKLGAAVPAFLMSGDTAPDRLREVTQGDYFSVNKPVAPITLRAMLNRLLKPAGAADRAAPMPPTPRRRRPESRGRPRR